MPDVTVLVNTYNRREHLHRVLLAYGRQTSRDFEVVVADDGSSDGTAALVRSLARDLPCATRFVTHRRRGHRRARILNEGIRAAEGATVLFTDCDSLPRADLVEVHLRRRERGRILVGGYVRLDRATTERLTPEDCAAGAHEALLDEEARWRLRVEDVKVRMYIALRRARRPHNMGLNYSAWKSDLEAVNGYDETYRGWGNADGDVRDRLRAVGVEPKSAWAEAVVFHLWHPPDPTKRDYAAGKKTRNAVWARRPDRAPRCLNGLEKLPGWKEEARRLRDLVASAERRARRGSGR